MLNPKTAVKLMPALALAAVIGSPLSAFAAPAVNLGADNAIESSEQGTAEATVPVTLTADGTWRDKADGEHAMGKYVVTVPTSISVRVFRLAPTPSAPSTRSMSQASSVAARRLRHAPIPTATKRPICCPSRRARPSLPPRKLATVRTIPRACCISTAPIPPIPLAPSRTFGTPIPSLATLHITSLSPRKDYLSWLTSST